jgi:hypothetical protein
MLIDYIFAAFYAVSYESLPIGRKSNAGMYASLIVGLPMGGCLAIIIKFFLHIRGKVPGNFELVAMLVALTCYGIVNWYYSREDRDSKVYETYKTRHKVMSKPIFIILAVMMICAPFFIVGII